MITLLFTKSGKIGSRIIRWGYGGKTSHFAIGLDNRISFESTFGGTKVDWLESFYERAEPVYFILLDFLTLEEEELIYRELIQTKRDKGYDYLGLLYLSLKAIFYKIIGKTMVTGSNPWADANRYLCVEIAACLYVIGLKIENLSSILPDDLYFQLNAMVIEMKRERLKNGDIY